jgi:hypothetical protein
MSKIQPFPGFEVNHLPVIAARPLTDHPTEDCRVVLCDRGSDGYVTWVIGPSGDACWGHYSTGNTDADYRESYEDFLTR